MKIIERRSMSSKTILFTLAGFALGCVATLQIEHFLENSDRKNSDSTLAVFIEGSSGSYTRSNDHEFPTDGYILNMEMSSCVNGGNFSQNSVTKKINLSVSSSDTCMLYFDKHSESDNTLEALGLTVQSGKPNLSTLATTDEGIYMMKDDYGFSYYFRGAPENNYVKFAGYYWRIIRINGDGSLRIIYDGTTPHANGDNNTDRRVTTSAFNSVNDDNAYVGYMYGLAGTTTDANRCLMLVDDTVTDMVGTYSTENACKNAGGKWTTTAFEATHANVKSSTIKNYLESWYKTNIVDKGYSSAVSDTVFCGDKSIAENSNSYSGYTDIGYGQNPTLYGYGKFIAPNWALRTDPLVTFECPTEYSYTVNDTGFGNGDLTYPIGLISADEISAAGGRYYQSDGSSDNYDYYLYKGSWYWSLSPSFATFTTLLSCLCSFSPPGASHLLSI